MKFLKQHNARQASKARRVLSLKYDISESSFYFKTSTVYFTFILNDHA